MVRRATMPFSRSSVGEPSLNMKTTGFQRHLFWSAVPFFTSRCTQSARRARDSPMVRCPRLRCWEPETGTVRSAEHPFGIAGEGDHRNVCRFQRVWSWRRLAISICRPDFDGLNRIAGHMASEVSSSRYRKSSHDVLSRKLEAASDLECMSPVVDGENVRYGEQIHRA